MIEQAKRLRGGMVGETMPTFAQHMRELARLRDVAAANGS
jgi:hypothetical protein